MNKPLKVRRLELNDFVRLYARNLEITTFVGARVVVFKGLDDGPLIQVPVGSTGIVVACHESDYTVKFSVGSVRAPSCCLLLLKRRGVKK